MFPEGFAQIFTRHQGQARFVMEELQSGQTNSGEESQMVMLSVGVKVGMETGDHGYMVAKGGKEGLYAQWTFRGDMDDIGREPFPVSL